MPATTTQTDGHKTFVRYNRIFAGTKRLPPTVRVVWIFDKMFSGGIRPCAYLQFAKWTSYGKPVDVFSFQEGFASEYPPGVWRLRDTNRDGISVSGDYSPMSGAVVLSAGDYEQLRPQDRQVLAGMIEEAMTRIERRVPARRNPAKKKRSRYRDMIGIRHP